MNSMQLKDKLRNISKEKNVDFNTLLRLYMYDRFIERLAVSKYRDNFILKGGFYLSTLFGLESRSTKDIDTAIKDAKPLDKFQFVRNGFFSVDTKYTTPEKLVFNRIVPLKSSFKLKK